MEEVADSLGSRAERHIFHCWLNIAGSSHSSLQLAKHTAPVCCTSDSLEPAAQAKLSACSK